MGAVNWLAVVAAALAAAGVLAGGERLAGRPVRPLPTLAVTLLAAAMLGHALARIGAEKLALKPWLYWMQSGGLAIAFVAPAVWLGGLQQGHARCALAREMGGWLLAYLAMGTAFRLLAP